MRKSFRKLGYEDYNFFWACAIGCGIISAFGLTYNYFVFGHLPEQFTTPGHKNQWSQFGNFMERTNPKAKYCHFSGRYITDPVALMRPLPKNPEKYFTIETIKKVSYKENKENTSFGQK